MYNANNIEVNYRYNSQNEEKKQKVLDIFLESDYGATVSYEEVNEVLMMNLDDVDELKYVKNFVSKLKNLLIDRGRVLQSVRGVGWYILKPQHIASFTYRNYIVKPQRMYQKASRILDKFDKRSLSEDRIQEFVDIRNLNQGLIDNFGTSVTQSAYERNRDKYERLED